MFAVSAYALAGTAVGAAVEHNDIIVNLGLLRKQHEAQSGTILQTIFKDIFGKGDMIKNKF